MISETIELVMVYNNYNADVFTNKSPNLIQCDRHKSMLAPKVTKHFLWPSLALKH